jgi:hypothetical protein
LKRILTIVALVLMLSLTVSAQTGTASGSGIVVRSSPPGAEVILKGDALVSGVTPATFRYPLVGEYELTVKRPGYDRYRTHVILDPSQQMQMDIQLSRKTGIKAAIRSMFIPGWGQWYTEQRTRGFAFSLLFAGAVTTYLVADHRFDDKEETFIQRRTEYDHALGGGASRAELVWRHDALTSAQDDAYDAEDTRRLTIGCVAGVWGLNILDALLFTPRENAIFSVKGISVAPSTGADYAGITLSSRF